MSRKSNKVINIMFLTFLFSILTLNVLTPDEKFSQSENRFLTMLPKFNYKSLVSGKFTNKYSEYIRDQFVYKDFWVGLKSDTERLTLKSENNGIYFGKDGYLLEKYKEPNEILRKNIDTINYFKNRNPNLDTCLLLVPNSVKVYEDKLPLLASPYDQLRVIENVRRNLSREISLINVYDMLNTKKDEYIYFRTDHHWTMRGAYYAYQASGNYLQFQPYDLDEFRVETVSDSFYGTYYSKANNKHLVPDSIEIFKPESSVKYEVNWLDTDKYSDSLFDYSHLNGKDKYSTFLDGNHSLMTIKTTLKNNKKIIIFKDSYSHCFIPFLANHYEEIHVIDLRYYKLDIYEYISKNKIDQALFLYNISSFSSDESIGRLK